MFVRSGTNWSQQAKLTAGDGAADDVFGCSVALAGDTALVGAMFDDTAAGLYAGSAYVFVRSGTNWSQQAKLTAGDAAAGDQFGYAVALTGDTALLGAVTDDTTAGTNAGSAYVFALTVVPDTTPPVLACPTNLVVTAPPGQCQANVIFPATATDDSDPAPAVTCVPPSGSLLPVGHTTALCTAVDASGNSNTCTFPVSVYPTRLVPVGEIWTPHETNRQWKAVASSADGTKLVAVDWYGTGSGGQIYTSTDSGATWTPRESNRNWYSVASSADGNKLVAGVRNGGAIYTSTDSGVSWIPRASNPMWEWCRCAQTHTRCPHSSQPLCRHKAPRPTRCPPRAPRNSRIRRPPPRLRR